MVISNPPCFCFACDCIVTIVSCVTQALHQRGQWTAAGAQSPSSAHVSPYHPKVGRVLIVEIDPIPSHFSLSKQLLHIPFAGAISTLSTGPKPLRRFWHDSPRLLLAGYGSQAAKANVAVTAAGIESEAVAQGMRGGVPTATTDDTIGASLCGAYRIHYLTYPICPASVMAPLPQYAITYGVERGCIQSSQARSG